MIEVVFGVPGSGKTTYLLNKIEELIQRGYRPSEIAYLTMTRNARAVAVSRMREKFGATKEDLKYFRTLHSICYEMLGHPTGVKEKDKKSFCDLHKVEYEQIATASGETYEVLGSKPTSLGGLYFNVYDRIRLLHEYDMSDLSWKHFNGIWVEACSGLITDSQSLRASKNGVKAYDFLKAWEQHKREGGLVDFADMLLLTHKEKHNIPTKILICDEFQDFSPLMYSIYKTWVNKKDAVYIAGDDDQAIYSFMGACPDFLLEEKKVADSIINLDTSHRCPSNILGIARTLIERNEKRHYKNMISANEGGDISEVYTQNLIQSIRPNIPTLILARTNYYTDAITKKLTYHNIPFRMIDQDGAWSNRFIDILNAVVKLTRGESLSELSIPEFRALVEALPSSPYLQRGAKKRLKEQGDIPREEAIGLGFHTLKNKKQFADALKLTKNQKSILSGWGFNTVGGIHIRVGTIHKAKGDEADDVFLQLLLPQRVLKGMNTQSDSDITPEERRVRYVALTRAKKRLILVRSGEYNDIKEF